MKYSFYFILMLVIISCDDDEIQRTDEENKILEIAYNRNYIYPEGFFHETISEGSIYYENTVSIKPESERENIWIELSTNDKNEALLWSNKSNEYSSVNREITSERETDKYFEFKRQNIIHSNDILLSRTHKTNYFQSELDLFRREDNLTIGIYNGELSKENFKELVEYLWSCGSLRLDHHKVLVSQTKEFNDYYEQYIQSINIVHGDFGIKDMIYVYDNYFIMNKSDRELILVSNEIKTIEGKNN